MPKPISERMIFRTLFGCASWFAVSLLTAGPATGSQPGLADTIYRGVEDSPVQLENGRWEGEPYVEGGASRPMVGLVENFSLEGDLDGDGEPETAVLLWQSQGGSGNFQYIAILKNQQSRFRNIATAPVGDRVQVRAGGILDGVISLDVVQQGEHDAACCPSQLARRSWKLVADRLTEQEARIDGVLSLETLEGAAWVLTRLDRGNDLPESIEISLAFSEGRVSGHSGCNRFSASVEEGDTPGQLRIGPVTGTRMACPGESMAVESRFLDLLGKADRYGFMAGGLLLTGSSDSHGFRLGFAAESQIRP